MPRAPTTADPFNAIAEPRRRDILTLLADEEWPVTDIAERLRIGQPSVSKHLRVLLDVGLVDVRREGRQAYYRTNATQIKAIHDWTRRFERYWTHQLLRIKARAEGRTSTTP
ncbi:MAG: winged helix-turn-helix transcriptional regulator [Gemmatimonadaceae bacterium]|nr:winged helix-turn-helix transcriptional regulator [Gemmatimonadaceae bacterium]